VDLLIDNAVVGFGLWTLLYHGALLLGGWAATPAALSFAFLGVLLLLLGWHLYRRSRADRAEAQKRLGPPAVVIAAALGAGLLALIANRPDADDVFYVNRSSAVDALGALPLRDTMFADQVFAMIPGQYPPMASFEALLGTIAFSFGVPAASVTYYVIPPLCSMLAILALWRLLASWDIHRPRIAFVVALAYLLFGGAFHASFGNTWIERMWQGKILFISILVPTLLVYLARSLRWGSRSDAALCAAAAIAGVGLTSTAIFLLPAFYTVGVIAALLLGRRARAIPLLVPLGYLLAVGLAWLALTQANNAAPGEPGATQGLSLGPTTADIVTKVLGTGPYLVVGLIAGILGWIAIRQRHARVLALLLAATAALAVSPLGLAVMDAVGLPASIRWRMMWLLPVAPLFGALAAAAGARLGRAGAVAIGSAAAAGVVLAGLPLWSPANGVTLGWPTWKWSSDVQQDYQRIAAVTVPGDIVGVGEPTGAMVTAVSGETWSVNPRGNYTRGMDNQPGFCAEERFLIAGYAQGSVGLDAEVTAALARLGVTVLVLPKGESAPDVLLGALGFATTEQPGILRRDRSHNGNQATAPCTSPSSAAG
jgi:uncharacterized membrane protein